MPKRSIRGSVRLGFEPSHLQRTIPHVVRPRGMIPLGTPISEHQGLCPCHPALAAEGSGARGGGAAPHSPAEAVRGRGVQGCAAPVLPFAGTVEPFRRAGNAALDRDRLGASGST